MDRADPGGAALTLSELLGLDVRTESGHDLGRVHDIRAELEPGSLRITGLVVAKLGTLERLGLGAPGAAERLRSRNAIPWEHVVRSDRRGVIVHDDPRSTS
jgi:sporulation protein YlmC with PRC-barrel domain